MILLCRSLNFSWFVATIVAIGGLFLAGCGGATPSEDSPLSWNTTTPLPKAVYSPAATTDGQFLYVLGGVGGTGNIDLVISGNPPDGPPGCPPGFDIENAGLLETVYRTKVTSDATLEEWRPKTSMDINPEEIVGVQGHGASIIQGRLYAIAGNLNRIPLCGDAPPQQTILSGRAIYSELGSDGRPEQPWTDTNQDFNPGVVFYGHAMVSDTIYVIGGWDGDVALNMAQKAVVQPDGSLDGWRRIQSIPRGLNKLYAVATSRALYVIGGMTSVGTASDFPRNEVYYAELTSDGSITSWRETTPLPHPLFHHTAAIMGGKFLMVMGGADRSDDDGNAIHITNEVFVAEIQKDNTLGGWQAYPALPEPRYRHATASTESTVYVIGGFKDPELEQTDTSQENRQDTVYLGRFILPPEPPETPGTS